MICKYLLERCLVILITSVIISCQGSYQTNDEKQPVLEKEVVLNADEQYQAIDGFGVNITPAQWNDGNLKPIVDMIVDDLGSTLIRFDCYGKADWLDPARQNPDKTFPEEYLAEVYKSKIFEDAWETFRYFNEKGIEPIFNISGRIPSEWAGEDGERLVDFESYAIMAVSLLKWARFEENLKFSLFMPYNETNLGFPEGPLLKPEDCVPATRELWKRMKDNGFEDVKIIVMGDSHIELDNIKAFLVEPDLREAIYAFSGHTYGNGYDEDSRDPWPWGDSPFKEAINMINDADYNGKPLWITEYGDLDQTGEIGFEFAWRSNRRLIRLLNDGCTAAQAWDAFDNFHEHDGLWAVYGLLKTDTLNWTYKPKKRYFAAKQVYRYLLPGYVRIACEGIIEDPDYRYARWTAPLKNIEMAAFMSPSGEDLTIVGMSSIESNVDLVIDIGKLKNKMHDKSVKVYHTTRNEDCQQIFEGKISGDKVHVPVRERSIFTITTL